MNNTAFAAPLPVLVRDATCIACGPIPTAWVGFDGYCWSCNKDIEYFDRMHEIEEKERAESERWAAAANRIIPGVLFDGKPVRAGDWEDHYRIYGYDDPYDY